MIKNRKGSILVFALWTLAILSVFAVQIGLTIGGRANLIARIEKNGRLRYIAESAVKKAVAVLKKDVVADSAQMNKSYRYNNPQTFREVALNDGLYDVSYVYCDWDCRAPQKRFGISEEESKLNINTATREELTRLLIKVTSANDDAVNDVVDGILGWRGHGDKEISGFYSDDYYAGLPEPYQAKHAEFELLEELMLIKGMTKEFYQELSPFITVYGDGQVNINTAPGAVLFALGLDEDLAGKILSTRRGIDGIEATADDHLFLKTFDVAAEVKNFVYIDAAETAALDKLNLTKKIKTISQFYRVNVSASLSRGQGRIFVKCVYNLRDNLVEAYRENNVILY